MIGTITFLDDKSVAIDTGKEIILYRPATFLARVGARLLDVLVIIIPTAIIPILPAWLYFALQQSGSSQATFGQGVFHIVTISTDGAKISFGQASGRFFGNLLNVLTLFIGLFMFFFNDRNQCLHDYLSGCMVVKEIDRVDKTTEDVLAEETVVRG